MAGFLKHIPILLLAVVLSAIIVSIVMLSSVPPVSRDALTHHLAVPKIYLKHGGIHEIPSIIFSYYPMNLDLLYMIPLYFGNDIIPKFIHFSFALLTAGLIFFYLKKRTDLFHALLGVVFFLSLPVIVQLSITVYVDLGLIFFSTASILSVFKWMEDRFKVTHLLVSGCWCGLALGTKYNGLVILLLLTLFIPVIYIREGFKSTSGQFRAAGYGVIFLAAALLVFSPWMIRNHLWKQNPIYPLYHHWFSQKAFPVPVDMAGETDTEGSALSRKRSPDSGKKIGLFTYRRIAYNESWWQIASVPVRIFFSGQDNDPQRFDGRLSPFLFFLPFLALIRSREKRPREETEIRVLLMFSLLFILVAFFTVDMRIRYIVSIVPPLVMLSILGLYRVGGLVHARFPDRAKAMTVTGRAVVVCMLLLNTGYIFHQFREVRPFDYLSGRVDRDAYIERHRKEYPVMQYANTHLGLNAKILNVFLGNRIYYSDRMMLIDAELFFNAVRQSDVPHQISQDLTTKGVTHMMIRMDLFDNWIENNFDEKKKELIRLFFREHVQWIYYKNGYALCEII